MHYIFGVLTSYSCLPNSVCVLEARHNVVGDDEGETKAVGAAILECECITLLICLEWDGQD